MGNLSFKLWLFEVERIVENNSPGPGWFQWKVNHDDYNGRYKKGDLVWYNRQMPTGQKIIPISKSDSGDKNTKNTQGQNAQNAQNIQDRPRTQAGPVRLSSQSSMVKNWIWAKSISTRPEYQMPAVNLDLAVRQYDDENWMFVILSPEENRLVSRGTIPNVDIKNVVKSQKNAEGKSVSGSKPSEILQAIIPKKEGPKSNTIPDEHITSEQKEIENKFASMLVSPKQSHMMISALAGTGKTTVLKHLAWKFGKGKKWLYLVFNSANKQEAKEEFPPSVQVETTNSWAGRELLDKNHLHPTDRIQNFSSSDKAKMVVDTPAFLEMTKSLKIPDHNTLYGSDPNRLDRTKKTLWYAIRGINTEFKMEVVKILGLIKSFAVDPRNENELESNIQSVMEKYDLNIDLESSKEKIQKNSRWALDYLDDLFGTSFIQKDFSKELAQAAIWTLHQVMPHVSTEKFIADSGNQRGTEQNLGAMRDFDDDLWFSAIHADELQWPKYEVVLVDEVQDFNTAQQIILKKLAENGAKIVAVGDENQSIYRFRGADSDAFKQLETMLGDVSHDKDIKRGLTSNFRSRQAIIDMSNAEGEESGHVSNLVKGRNFKEGPGKIGKGSATKYELTYDDAFDNLNQEMKDMGEVKQTAFLSRTNEPLVHASLKLMKQGIPFVILGKDIANDLNKHVDKIIGLFFLQNNSSVYELESSLSSYIDDQSEKHTGKVAMSSKLKELKETTEAMLSSIEQFKEESPEGTVADFRKWLRSKFGGLDIEKSGREGDMARAEYKKQLKEQNPVVLSTVHKSKGLQFQRVYILRDDLWPHPRSKRPEDLSQELNNKYIGRTRGEDEAHVLVLKGQPGYPENEE